MLAQRFAQAAQRLVSQADWKPYPNRANRAAWDALPDAVRGSLVAGGEAALRNGWKPLLATRFLDYARNGNRSDYESEYFERRNTLVALALAACAEGRGRFLDEIANGVWLICEETYWGLPAHVGIQRLGSGLPDVGEPTVDLFAAETGAALAYISYLLGDSLDAVSPLIRPRIADEIDRRILTPNLERDDFWWMGFQTSERPMNWTPWINSNWLACTLLMEQDAERRRETVSKIARSLDYFIDGYPEDGGCDEGPGYWMRAAGSLFDCLDQLYQATGGQVDVFDEPLIQAMGRFIYLVHIDGSYYVNFADAPALIEPEAHLIFRYGQAIGDHDMAAFGAWAARTTRDDGAGNWGRPIESPMRWLRAIFSADEMASAEAYAPQPRDVWLPITEVMAARDEARTGRGLFVVAKGGHNNEHHNHNDVGQFVVFADGLPLLVDAGVETYTRKTFSPQRYELWTMQSAYHNLPVIDGMQQSAGEAFAARFMSYHADVTNAELTLDIAGAYPREAGILQWRRTVRLHRGQCVTIEDEYELDHTPHSVAFNLLTPCGVALHTPGCINLNRSELPDGRSSGSGVVLYDGYRLEASVETIPIGDERLSRVWGGHLYRIVLSAVDLQPRDGWTLEIREA